MSVLVVVCFKTFESSKKRLSPSYLSDRFVTRSTVYDRNTRNKESANGQRTFLYRAIKLWNSLPRATDHCCRQPAAYVQKETYKELIFKSFLVS